MSYYRFVFLIKFCLLVQIIEAESSPRFDYDKAELDADHWNKLSRASLRKALNQKVIHERAKNVIIFLGDGMGISTITSARILKGQLNNRSGEESTLTFDEFPYVSLIKTYNVDYQVADSAGTATAYLCGVKANLGTLGVSARVQRHEPNCDIVEKNSVSSILKWAVDSGKNAGIVTTTRITHATPSAGYAHVANRYWEGFMPSETVGNCKDIARQLIEDEPGSKFKVILGGGRRSFLTKTTNQPNGNRTDGRNLIQDWIDSKEKIGLNKNAYKYVDTKGGLNAVNYNEMEYLLGLFNYTNMAYELERDKSDNGEPSIEEMTEAAIKILRKDKNGFVLLVEGGRIDQAHHDNYAVHSLYETLAFEKAIQKAIELLLNDNTLIVVTADHSHTLTINGEPKRGNSIFGIAKSDSESKPFTTLMYGNGPGYQKDRIDPSTLNTSNPRYQQLSAVNLIESEHGGEDVAVYSIGPMAHLFQGTQEQSYIAHVMGFAACIGEYQYEDHCPRSQSTALYNNKTLFSFTLLLLFIRLYQNYK